MCGYNELNNNCNEHNNITTLDCFEDDRLMLGVAKENGASPHRTELDTKSLTFYQDEFNVKSISKTISYLENHVHINLSDYIKTQIKNANTLVNIGTGVQVYKGENIINSNTGESQKEFRTFTDTYSIKVNNNDTHIYFNIDTNWLNIQINNITDILRNELIDIVNNLSNSVDTRFNNVQNQISTLQNQVNTINIDLTNQINNLQQQLEEDLNNIDFPVINGNSQGTGISIFNGLNNKKLDISTLKTDSLIINKENDGTININLPSSQTSTLTSFYVNSNYVPTQDSPSDGTIIRPYTNLTQALNKVIGSGTRLNPQYTNARVIVQTHSFTDLNPTINTLTIELQNVTITYTGSDTYVFDSEILYNLAPKNSHNEVTQNISFSIVGRGEIKTHGLAIMRAYGNKRSSTSTPYNPTYISFFIGEKDSDEILLGEKINYPSNIPEGDVKREDGTIVGNLYNPPLNLKWTTKLTATHPVIDVRYNNHNQFIYSLRSYGILSIKTIVNTGIKFEDTTAFLNKLTIEPYSDLISVYSTTNQYIQGFSNIYNVKNNPAIHFKNSHNYIKEIFRINPYNVIFHGYQTFMKIEGTYSGNTLFRYDSDYYIGTLINLRTRPIPIGVNNDSDNIAGETNFWFNNSNNYAYFYSNINNLINADYSTTSTISHFYMKNSDIKSVKNYIGVNCHMWNNSCIPLEFIPITFGTISNLNDKTYISNIDSYASDLDAQQGGVLKNGLYINTTTNSLTKR